MVSSSSAIFDVTINNNTIKKKISKGRQKIEIKKIEAKDSRQVTFSKRRTGLFKKAAELCVLTGARVAILVKSPGGKVYVFDEYDLIDGYLNEVGETGQLGFPKFNQDYDDVSQELVVYNRREMISSSSNSEESVDGMDIGQLEEYVCTPEEMKKDAVAEADELKMNKNEVVEASDSVVIDNSPAMLDIDLPLDMSWLDSDLLDMSWIDSFTDNSDTNTNDAFNLNFHHGVEV